MESQTILSLQAAFFLSLIMDYSKPERLLCQSEGRASNVGAHPQLGEEQHDSERHPEEVAIVEGADKLGPKLLKFWRANSHRLI